MAELPRYQATRIALAPAPELELAPLRESQRMQETLSRRLDQLQSYVTSRAEKEAQAAALKYAAENPVTQEQVNEALAGGKGAIAKFFGAFTGEGGTVYQETLQAARGSVLANNLSVKAAEQIDVLKNLADIGELDYFSASQKIKDITDGYATTVAAFNPEASIQMRAKIGVAGNTLLKHIGDIEVKKAQAMMTAELDSSAQLLQRVLPDIYKHGDSETPDMGTILADDLAATQLDSPMAQALQFNMPGHIEIFTKINREAKINGISAGLVESYSDESAAYSALRSNELGKYQRMWNNMPTEDRDAIKKKVKESFAEVARIKKDEDDSKRTKLEQDRGMIQLVLGTQDVSDKTRKTIVDFMYRANIATEGSDIFSQEYIESVARGDDRKTRLSSAEMAKFKVLVNEGQLTPIDTEQMVNNLKISGFEKQELDKIYYSNQNQDFRDAKSAIQTAIKALPNISDRMAKAMTEEAEAIFRSSLEADVEKKLTTRQHGNNAIAAARQSFYARSIETARTQIINLLVSPNVKKKLKDEYKTMTSDGLLEYLLSNPSKVSDIFENPNKNSSSIRSITNSINIVNGQ